MALVLTRRSGETICIGDDITVTISRVEPTGQVVLRIEAPDHIEVDRREIRRRKLAERQYQHQQHTPAA